MLDLDRVRRLLDTRRPGHSLPQPFYRDPDIYAFDLAAIHARSWFIVGFEVELPEPGSRLSLKIGESPIIVLRDRDGAVRGFHNSCRHRGAQICELGAGKSSRLVCPYHQWTYGLDGRLIGAGRMQESFDRAEHGLVPIQVETAAGCVYVCLDETPPDFEPFRRSIEPLLGTHDLAGGKLAAESTLVEQANWKLVMENARECYHCATKHPELATFFPIRNKGQIDPDYELRLSQFDDRMAGIGLANGPLDGSWWQAGRFPLNEGCVSMTADGQPCVARRFPSLGEQDVGSMRWALEGHSFCHAVGDFVFMFSAMPTGPQETVVTSKWIVPKEAEEGVDYDLDSLTRLWTITNMQDRDLAENNQRGINGLGYRPGPYSELAESLVLRFVDWYCDRARAYIDTNA